jgi:hypothetical protein
MRRKQHRISRAESKMQDPDWKFNDGARFLCPTAPCWHLRPQGTQRVTSEGSETKTRAMHPIAAMFIVRLACAPSATAFLRNMP